MGGAGTGGTGRRRFVPQKGGNPEEPARQTPAADGGTVPEACDAAPSGPCGQGGDRGRMSCL